MKVTFGEYTVFLLMGQAGSERKKPADKQVS